MSDASAPSATSSRLSHLASLLALACLVLLVGATLALFSMNMHPRFLTMRDAVDSQRAILERRAFVFADEPPVEYGCWRNRLMVPLAIETMTKATGLSFGQAYIVVRLLTACLAVVAFGALIHRAVWPNLWFAGAVTAVFCLMLLPTFLHIYEIPSDSLDAAFFSALLLCVLERWRAAFALVLLVALVNRESAIFATFVWFALHAWPLERSRFLRETAWCAGVGVIGTSLVVSLRVGNAVRGQEHLTAALQEGNPFTLVDVHLRMIRDFVSFPTYTQPLFYLFGFLLFLALMAVAYWRRLSAPARRLALAALGIYVLSICFGNIDELRIYIPSLAISVFLLAQLARDSLAASRSTSA